MESFLSQNGFSTELGNAADLVMENASTEEVYQIISTSFQLSETDANDLFAVIETIELIKQHQDSKIANAKWGWGEVSCAVSVAATILVTASAVTIGSAAAPGAGTALGFWVAGKVLATVGVVTSCAGLNQN